MLAITNHDQLFDIGHARPHAAEKGLLLIPGVERTIGWRHVLILNANKEAESVEDFDGIARLKEQGAVVIAPHPFYPSPKSLGRKFKEHIDLFDAIEYSFFHHRWFDFNNRAVRESEKHKLRLVGNSDTHKIDMLGQTYTFLRAEKSIEDVLRALRSGETQVVTRPVSTLNVIQIGFAWLRSLPGRPFRHLKKRQASFEHRPPRGKPLEKQ